MSAPVPTAYDVAMLLIDALPQFRVRDGHHFDSIGACIRHTGDGGVEIDCDVTFNYFAIDARPVHFVLRVSEPELVPIEADVEIVASDTDCVSAAGARR